MKKRIVTAILVISVAVLVISSAGTAAILALSPESILPPLLSLSLLTLAAVFAAALFVARIILKPLEDPEQPLPVEGYPELAPLLIRLRRQQAELVRRNDEFRAATDSMSEGLVILGENGGIISINRAAAKLFESETLPREIDGLIEKSRRGERAERILERNNLSYQLNVSPVVSENKTVGFALLIFDVTERERAEQMRREFTANVSHELKTPLHSISGCSELLLHGMVRPEDVGQFAGQIYSESARMIRLVDDIIKLSRLDEGAEDMGRSEVDLYPLAQSVVQDLAPEAEKAEVTLSLCGGSATLYGIPHMLWMILHNLCDNAIKYNKKNGSVTVTVESGENEILLSVSDTGIGIAPEHQSRVFERFYRVDKSHSKEVGGTGLGLSIVKHAARLHDAALEMKSTPDVGTTITLRFPKTVS